MVKLVATLLGPDDESDVKGAGRESGRLFASDAIIVVEPGPPEVAEDVVVPRELAVIAELENCALVGISCAEEMGTFEVENFIAYEFCRRSCGQIAILSLGD